MHIEIFMEGFMGFFIFSLRTGFLLSTVLFQPENERVFSMILQQKLQISIAIESFS